MPARTATAGGAPRLPNVPQAHPSKDYSPMMRKDLDELEGDELDLGCRSRTATIGLDDVFSSDVHDVWQDDVVGLWSARRSGDALRAGRATMHVQP